MKLKLTFISSVLSLFIFAQNQSIQFETGTFSEALAKAKKENKLIFMDAYTTWCGPCKWMAKNIFTNDKVADYYNSNFICTKIDMEKGEGIEIAKKYDVRCYPNLLFIDGDGNLVHRSAGAAQEIDSYITLGELAKNPAENFAALDNEFKKNKEPKAYFLAKYINAISMTCLPYEDIVQTYFSIVPEKEYTSSNSWKIIFNHVNEVDNMAFQYLLKNRNAFEQLYSKDSVDMKITMTFQNSGDQILYSKDFSEKKYKEFMDEVAKLNFSGKEAVLFNLNLSLLYKKEKSDDIFDYALKNEKYLDEAQKNSICWDIFEKSSKKEHLNSALKLMNAVTSTETGKNWMYMDTYASLLFKAKNKAEAKKVAEEAIQLAKNAGVAEEDYKVTQALLEKINKL